MGNFTHLTHDINGAAGVAAIVTGSSAAVSYPAANVQTTPIAKHWRSTGVISESLLLDLGSAQAVTLIGVVNHNLTTLATITVTAGTTANPDGSQFGTTIPYRLFDAFKLLGSAQTYRYWKFTFADPLNMNGYIKVGYLLTGLATTAAFHWQYGSPFTDRFVNLNRTSAGGVPYNEAKYRIITQTFKFGPLSVTDMATLRALYRALLGSVKPLFIIPESQTNDGYFGRFTNDFTRTLDLYESADLDFMEDGRGRDIGA